MADAAEEKLELTMLNFIDEYYMDSRCLFNINYLIGYLERAQLINRDKAHVIIVEAPDNDLSLGDSKRYRFHVFLVHDNQVFDPLMFANMGVARMEIRAYLQMMFPNLRGVRFTGLSARDYAELTDDQIEEIFSEYVFEQDEVATIHVFDTQPTPYAIQLPLFFFMTAYGAHESLQ